MTTRAWEWDETVQRGTDYADEAEVEAYDRRMAGLRNVPAEIEKIITLLGLSADDVLLEVGTGTGAFARAAARRCGRVIAIDVSPVMLRHAFRRAQEERIDNIEFQEAGFLSYQHRGAPLSAVVSQLALHHLPDAWKLVALKRLAGFLRAGGAFYLTDVVFPDRAEADWPGYLQAAVDATPAGNQTEMAAHFREEFSTFDWMMREILVRSGFVIESAEPEGIYLFHYLCRRGPIGDPS